MNIILSIQKTQVYQTQSIWESKDQSETESRFFFSKSHTTEVFCSDIYRSLSSAMCYQCQRTLIVRISSLIRLAWLKSGRWFPSQNVNDLPTCRIMKPRDRPREPPSLYTPCLSSRRLGASCSGMIQALCLGRCYFCSPSLSWTLFGKS